jgi:biotin carboxyl carrier protein
MIYEIVLGGKSHRLELKRAGCGWSCRLDGDEVVFDCAPVSADVLSLVLNGKSYEIRRDRNNKIFVGDQAYEISVSDPRSWRGRKAATAAESGPRKLAASMPGKVVRVLATEGDTIQEGQGIVIVEAMKMQNEIRSPKDGRLQKLLVREGMNVNAGETLALVE